jgi:hypothetical protein
MNADELEILMATVAIGDRRTTGKYDVGYWALMAQEGRWTLPTAMRALAIFRTENPGEWIDPGYITSIIRDARRKAAETFVVPPEPEGIKNADLPKWHRAQIAAHQDRLLAAWSVGEPLPVSGVAQITEQKQLTTGMDLTGCPRDLREEIAQGVQRMGRLDRHRAAVSSPRAVEDNADRRAYARAELEAARQKWGEPE